MAAAAVSVPRWLTAEEQRVWRAYLDVSRLIDERLGRQLVQDSGLSLPEYEILVQLSEHPLRRMRMSELADRAVNSRSRLTHTVSRMEAEGLVRREPCPDDGRGVVAVLTESGYRAIADAAPGHVEAVRRSLFDTLSDADVDTLGRILGEVRASLRGAP